MKQNRANLTTEKRNKRSATIDQLSTRQMVSVINDEDACIAGAVAKEKTRIAKVVDMVVDRLRQSGRLFYVGAGTSGRLGVLDASECPPTFGVSPLLVQGIIAGGRRALVRSIEGAEDDPQSGVEAVQKKNLTEKDVVIGIAACGLTPYVHGALEYARSIKAATAFVTCAPEAVKHIPAEIVINPTVGPEVITGSTRMKAGTATKLVLNTITTVTMIKLGKVYGNLMVDLNATNEKLQDRSIRIVQEITGLSASKAAVLLDQANGKVKPAIVMHCRDVDYLSARQLLKEHNDMLRDAIKGTL